MLYPVLFLWACVVVGAADSPDLPKGDYSPDRLRHDEAELRRRLECLLDRGPCTGAAAAHTPYADLMVLSACTGCNLQQKSSLQALLKVVKENYPSEYRELMLKYNPEYFNNFEEAVGLVQANLSEPAMYVEPSTPDSTVMNKRPKKRMANDTTKTSSDIHDAQSHYIDASVPGNGTGALLVEDTPTTPRIPRWPSVSIVPSPKNRDRANIVSGIAGNTRQRNWANVEFEASPGGIRMKYTNATHSIVMENDSNDWHFGGPPGKPPHGFPVSGLPETVFNFNLLIVEWYFLMLVKLSR